MINCFGNMPSLMRTAAPASAPILVGKMNRIQNYGSGASFRKLQPEGSTRFMAAGESFRIKVGGNTGILPAIRGLGAQYTLSKKGDFVIVTAKKTATTNGRADKITFVDGGVQHHVKLQIAIPM